jgi:hypothetical protein
MNANLGTLIIAAAVLAAASNTASAGQTFGRDSVYADARATFPSAKSPAAPAVARSGRGSVYAHELPAPTPKEQVKFVGTIKPGRA